MTFEEARKVIMYDNSEFSECCTASITLCNSEKSSYEDWLLCLTRSGIPAEVAACKLYAETERPWDTSLIDLDIESWRNYLSGIILTS